MHFQKTHLEVKEMNYAESKIIELFGITNTHNFTEYIIQNYNEPIKY